LLTEFNLLFQSEKPLPYRVKPETERLIKSLCSNFLKMSCIRGSDILTLNHKNPANFVPAEQVYLRGFAERVWRRPGERFARCCISPRTPFGGGGGVMVWAGNSFYGRTELIFIEHETLTADRYIGQCLETHVVPYAPFVGGNFLLMHDNARPHTARIVTNYLDTVEIPRLEWPARSPDMNPIEHVWDKLGRNLKKKATITRNHPRAANSVV
jgi:hypothetical protein